MNQEAAAVEVDSRIDPRFPATAVSTITSMKLSPGDTVELLNISRSGVLVEGRTRFVPGTRITVLFDGGFAPARVKGKVVRSYVSSISDGMLRYHSGIQFDNRLDSNPGEMAVAQPALPNPPGGLNTEEVASAGAAIAAAPAPRAVNRWW
jgi:PilZ domain